MEKAYSHYIDNYLCQFLQGNSCFRLDLKKAGSQCLQYSRKPLDKVWLHGLFWLPSYFHIYSYFLKVLVIFNLSCLVHLSVTVIGYGPVLYIKRQLQYLLLLWFKIVIAAFGGSINICSLSHVSPFLPQNPPFSFLF